jgi:hypothetical protein
MFNYKGLHIARSTLMVVYKKKYKTIISKGLKIKLAKINREIS